MKYEPLSRITDTNIPNFIETSTAEINIKDFQFLLIVKPIDRSGSRGVTRVVLENELSQAIYYALNESFCKKTIIEEYIEGKEVSVETISWNGEHTVLTITDKIATPTNAVDLAEVLIKIILSPITSFGTYNFSNEDQSSWYDFEKKMN